MTEMLCRPHANCPELLFPVPWHMQNDGDHDTDDAEIPDSCSRGVTGRPAGIHGATWRPPCISSHCAHSPVLHGRAGDVPRARVGVMATLGRDARGAALMIIIVDGQT